MMASATQSRTLAYKPLKPSTPRKASALEAQKAREELLDDLMNDARKCLATKSVAERKTIASAINKIAHG
ncbi:MAG: hypothetical protein ABSA85_12350 [Terracidiphilus sp.]|jgi:hypothetical protein